MKVFENFDLSDYNGYRVSARCRKAFLPETDEEVLAVVNSNPDIIFLGSGHNIILSKEFYDADFLIFNGNLNQIELGKDEVTLEVEAGALMADVSSFALERRLSGIEVFYDIPSSLGGAVVMNAGASGEEIKDVLLKVRYLDIDNLVIKELKRDEIDFEYRNSFFQKNPRNIVLKAWLQLKQELPDLIEQKMNQVKDNRWLKQPRDFPNCGSVFKRPEGRFVGPMLDELGLKGFRSGGAQVSEKHSGFIVNVGHATGKDILDVIEVIKQRVFERFGVDLEVEQRII
jgi:UDP-N-acetylmuramate dehydrogenase